MESTLGHSRRFLNLIVGMSRVKSLCCIDLMHQPLFNPTTPTTQPPNGNGSQSVPQTPAALMMEQLVVPASSFSFQASPSAPNYDQRKIECFPLTGRQVICADQLGRTFHCDAERGHVRSIPCLHKPKSMPLSLFVPNPDVDNDKDLNRWDWGSSLFVIERFPKSEVSYQVEAFVYRHPSPARYSRTWHCELLPPPPYLHEPNKYNRRLEICSYAALGSSSICISVNGIGTYRLNIATQTWEEVGKWTLPFYGKVEYVLELNLWFGLSAESHHLAATDLSSLELDSQPQLLEGPWKELHLPEEWKECEDSQLVSLGFGKFCVARFLHPNDRIHKGELGDEELSSQNCITVLTGVEVVPRVPNANVNSNSSGSVSSNGISELRMIPHKSRCHTSNGTIVHTVF
ncbi:uncharacterized protein LOC127768702 [Oryza glaberrima]|uniref:uncharacterized protein LOC127768702 n=1 Tax=Oryza glaberrima TaxID=4538 RepID=UPI00023E001F|nr:uncharacterized protein LOC127768702 [Oryza glaberrima]